MDSKVRNRLSELGLLEYDDEFCLISKEPAIVIIDGLDGKRNTLAVEWFDSERRGQFEFHLMASLKSFEDKFATHPEMGRVVFLGQVREWLNPEARQQIVRDLHLKSDEAYLVYWIVPIGMGTNAKGEPLPVSVISEVILIGHPEYGLLRPEKYYSEETKQKVMNDFYRLLGWPPRFPLAQYRSFK